MSGRFADGLRLMGREIVADARAIAQLTFGRADGIRAFTNDVGATRRSFVTAIFSLPIFVMFHVLDWLAGVGPIDPPHVMVLDLLTFPISWAGFALVSLPLVRVLKAEAQWPRYISAWNWSNFAQYVLLFVTSVPAVLHVPPIASETCALVGYGWALWLEWFVTRLVLNVSPTGAALLVAVDVGFSAIVSLVTLVPWQSVSLG
ncbi:hypothetical protein [Acidisoma sp.]|uniref:hypothetical protein n=1 Tax=Acidisoma sp. TaxID=1872115 RepID=UPI003B00DBE7